MKKTTSQPAKTAATRTKSGSTASPPRRQKQGERQDRPRAAAPSETPPLGREEQVALFDRAVSLFQNGRLPEASLLFEQAATGPVREVAHSARVHLRVCAQRAGEQSPEPSTAEDHYALGVALLNRSEFAGAERHLIAAAGLAPQADHIQYALALARGLRGDLQQAAESLRRAIALNPRNRSQARHDPDFAALIHEPPLAAVLHGEREPGG